MSDRDVRGFDRVVFTIKTLASAYRVGAIAEAEQAVDAYLADFQGYPARLQAIDLLLRALARPENRAINRGGLFEQIERHLRRCQTEFARSFQ